MPGKDPMKDLEAKAAGLVASAIGKKGYAFEDVRLERPPAELGADLAFPCYQLAMSAKKLPVQIAQELAGAIETSDLFEVRAEGPYLNFVVDPGFLVKGTMEAIEASGREYGSGGARGVKAIVEHTSANPTDSLHVGRGRNPIIGDTLARVMRMAGYDVETQYYVDDLGKQAATKFVVETEWDLVQEQIGVICKQSIGDSLYLMGLPPAQKKEVEERQALLREPGRLSRYALGSTVAALEEVFFPEFRDRKVSNMINEIVNALERGHPETTEAVAWVVDKAMSETIVPTLERLNIRIDNYVHESMFTEPTKGVIDGLRSSGKAQEEENGALFIDMAEFGVSGRNTRFFFTRGDGTSLYATRDIAYHIWKFEQVGEGGALVNVLGEDHKLESRQIDAALKLLGHALKPDVVFYAFVTLPEGKMSTRKGRLVYLDQLLDEGTASALEEVRKRREDLSEEGMARIARAVAIGAVRFNIIKVQPEKKIVFRWEDALNLEGGSAPFVMYSHARAASILRKAGGDPKGADCSFLKEQSEVALVKKLATLPGLVDECARKHRVHQIAGYLLEVATLFNQFYRDCPVLPSEGGLRNARLALVSASRTVLSVGLDLLGIEALEEM